MSNRNHVCYRYDNQESRVGRERSVHQATNSRSHQHIVKLIMQCVLLPGASIESDGDQDELLVELALCIM
jgi:hypothetical protein